MSPDEIEWIMQQSTWSLEVEGQHPDAQTMKRCRSVLTIPLPDESPNRDIPPTKSRQQASGDTTPWSVHPGAAPQLLATK